MGKPFIPTDYTVPLRVETPDFILRKLTTQDAEQDYEAVMSSKESLRKIFSADDPWPEDEMTLEDNYRDLQDHENDFDQRKGFTYTVVSPAEDQCIGCLYIYPISWKHRPYDAQVFYWVRDSVKPSGLEEKLGTFVHRWLETDWPLHQPAFPGRTVSWEVWEALKKAVQENQK